MSATVPVEIPNEKGYQVSFHIEVSCASSPEVALLQALGKLHTSLQLCWSVNATVTERADRMQATHTVTSLDLRQVIVSMREAPFKNDVCRKLEDKSVRWLEGVRADYVFDSQ